MTLPRRSRASELDFEIHIDDSCQPAPETEAVDIHVEESQDETRDSLGSSFGGEGSIVEPNWVSHEPTTESEDTDIDIDANEDTVIRRESEISMEEAEARMTPSREADIRAAAREALRQGHSRQSSTRSAAMSDVSYEPTSSRNSMSNHSESHSVASGSRRSHSDVEGSNSSHHEQEDDVFSDHSPRSSMGSIPEGEKREQGREESRRLTGASCISDIQPYDPDEQFVPTIRGTPRAAFRSPSAFQNSQTQSPPVSVGKRTPRTSISKLGSPSLQYSPKKTPPRFKRNTPPLVLLHVTLLPLRWPWGPVLESIQSDETSKAVQSLREAWRLLQGRLGDTVADRGVLLPHPQNDFEVLEERLLEAVELPLRRRARILECGHYIGPANEMKFLEDLDSDDEDYEEQLAATQRNTHWCTTCRSDIHFDSLGEGKVFRTKVYASNGLMKAGAWDACWRQMERVDVEIEPIVDQEILDELERLAAQQERLALEQELQESLQGEAMYDHEDDHEDDHDAFASSPVQERDFEETPAREDRHQRESDRLREIYGEETLPSPPETGPSTEESHEGDEFANKETPPSPTVEAMKRRESRQQAFKSASLPELALQAGKVFFQDRKNIAIVLLGVLVLILAMQSGSETPVLNVANESGMSSEQVMAVVSDARSVVEEASAVNACASCELELKAAREACAPAATVTVTETTIIAAATSTPSVPLENEKDTMSSAVPEGLVQEVEEFVETVVAEGDEHMEL